MLMFGIGEKGPNLLPTDDSPSYGAPSPAISLRSLAKLDEMREMITCTDEEELNKYLRSIEGAGARSRDDLIAFVNMIESLPIGFANTDPFNRETIQCNTETSCESRRFFFARSIVMSSFSTQYGKDRFTKASRGVNITRNEIC